MANFMCRTFGHKKPEKGWWSPGEEYGRVIGIRADGTGRTHAQGQLRCARCGNWHTVFRFHPSSYGLVKADAEA